MMKAESRTSGMGIMIDVIGITDDGLQKVVFTFRYDERKHALYARTYLLSKRDTKRHGWKRIDMYGFSDRRYDTLDEMPYIPPMVKSLAMNEFKETLSIL